MLNSKHNSETQKITICVPKKLLNDAQNVAHENITETVKNALRLLIAYKAAQNLRTMRGKVQFSIDVDELREDK